ncbi:hypothetical protein ACFFGT_32350 [Mucilaginibacter angelicae]|uniref:Uncharacterized protein n=1 Tax=Mucilaginibacter angelicae TaxID=869718 RepID=A0ABV6LHK9_9SPHI
MESSSKPLPFFFVGQALVNQRTADFVNQKNNLLSEALGKPDTRSIWYSRDHIAGLLDEIDHAGGDGLRIAFGMYERGHQFAGQLCLMMNPTRGVAVGDSVVHQAVILENEPDFAERSAVNKDYDFGNGLPGVDKGFNLGSPCPPICD